MGLENKIRWSQVFCKMLKEGSETLPGELCMAPESAIFAL
jgi:hypothetical protein